METLKSAKEKCNKFIAEMDSLACTDRDWNHVVLRVHQELAGMDIEGVEKETLDKMWKKAWNGQANAQATFKVSTQSLYEKENHARRYMKMILDMGEEEENTCYVAISTEKRDCDTQVFVLGVYKSRADAIKCLEDCAKEDLEEYEPNDFDITKTTNPDGSFTYSDGYMLFSYSIHEQIMK